MRTGVGNLEPTLKNRNKSSNKTLNMVVCYLRAGEVEMVDDWDLIASPPSSRFSKRLPQRNKEWYPGCSLVYIHICTPHMHTHMCVHIHMLVRTYTCALIHAHTRTYTHLHTCTQTHTRTCIHTCRCTHMCTCAHIHTHRWYQESDDIPLTQKRKH